MLNDVTLYVHTCKTMKGQDHRLVDLSGKRKKLNFDVASGFERFVNLFFAVMVFVEIAIYNSPTKGNVSFLVGRHLIQTPIITTSILHHMSVFHSTGHMILYIRRMFSMLFCFLAMSVGVLFLFTRLFSMMSEMESIGGCISEFSSFFNALYSSYLIFLNTFDLRGLSIGVLVGVETVHICFVFIIGILLYNLLIALFSDEVKMISDNKDILLCIEQSCIVGTIDYLGLYTPIIRNFYTHMKRASIKKNFVCFDGKICLVAIDGANVTDDES